MAETHGTAGEWARVKGMVLGLWPLFLGVFALGVSATLAFVAFAWGATLAVASAVYILWSLTKGLKHVERYYKGARGEERVSGILRQLPDGYHVFNDFVAGNAHVDHVVAGPGGVFSVETKFWRGPVTVEDGQVLVDGRLPDRSPVDQAIREATLVKNTLAKAGWTGTVTPVLAFASDTLVTRRVNMRGTVILNSSEILESFASDRVVIPPEELKRLVSLMENIA